MQSLERMTYATLIAVAITLIVAGCGGEGGEQKNQVADMSAASAGHVAVPSEKIATLEQDVMKLKTEVQQLRHRIEVDAKTRSRHGEPTYPRQQGSRNPEDLRDAEFRARHLGRRNGSATSGNPAAARQDPATMTPEQRRAWHEENRRMREELSRMTPEQRRVWREKRRRMREKSSEREKTSESGKQASPDKEMQMSTDKQVKPKGESK